MDAFRFSPELFQLRCDVMAAFDRKGYQWLSHYSSIDCLHDLYGIEVCGIHEKKDAIAIRKLLTEMFPGWISGCLYYKDYGREPGWNAKIHRDKPRQRESWESS